MASSISWLETGNSKAGLTHILERHAGDFTSKGIINKSSENRGNAKGLFADYAFDGNSYRIAYGINGFIVSFYPID